MLRFACTVLTFVVLLNVTGSNARALSRPRGKQVMGIVENIDSTTHMLTIILDETCEGHQTYLEVKWTRNTLAKANGMPATFEVLRTGARVRIRYVGPLLGPRVLRKIEWDDAETVP